METYAVLVLYYIIKIDKFHLQ